MASVSKVSGATAISRVLGLVREQAQAYFFGASMATDAFVAAFRIPNLLRDLFAEGALSAAFVPIFKDKLVNESEDSSFALARTVASAILLVVGAIVLLGMIATPVLIFISANGFTEDAEKFALTIDLTRIMWVYLLLVSLSALVMGMLNSFGRFGVPALSPAMFNLGIIACVFIMYQWFDVPIYAMAIGVLVGGLGQLAMQLPQLWRIGFRFRWSFTFFDEGFRKVLRMFLPMVAGMSASRVNILISTLMASYLVEGSISYLNYSFRLMHFPLGVFAVALGTVALPNASELAARREFDRLGAALSESLSLNLFLIIPSAAFLAIIGTDLVDVIYRWGRFSQGDTVNTGLALLHYSYGLIGFAAVRVTVPIYYALKDSSLPMRISIISVAVNIALYYPLMKLLSFAGLAAATSIAGLVNFALLLVYLPRKGVSLEYRPLLFSFVKVGVASAVAFYGASMLPIPASSDWPEGIARLWQFGAKFTVGVILYLLLCAILRVPEMRLIQNRIRRRT
ncbi:MAG: murein biosynthesis integral membrane protein MurJ [Candidatus Zixiibacteriota bacterium]